MDCRGRQWGVVFYLAAAAVAAMAISYQSRSPVVRQRRDLAAREARLRSEVRSLWLRGVHLERARDALKCDPTMIERVARGRLGYGRVGEIAHEAAGAPEPLILALKANQCRPVTTDWLAVARESIVPCLALLAAGVLLAAFFANLSLEPESAADTGVFQI